MEIRIKSLKFDADSKLVEYVEKKVARLAKFHDGAGEVEVTLSLTQEPDNKKCRIHIHVPGSEEIVERSASRFEEAVTLCVDIMKEKLTREKEKRNEK